MQLGVGYSLLSGMRWLPRFRGKNRIAHRLSKCLADRTDVWLLGRNGFEYLVPSLKEPIAFELLVHGEYESETLELLKRLLRPGDCVIDVGANIGAFSLPASRMVGDTGHVLAIEASASVFRYLKSNLDRNRASNVAAIHGAAGVNEGGELSFFDAPIEKFGMGSRAPCGGRPGCAVPACSIDTALCASGIDHARVRVLKIDVEGFELDVLRGASQLLESARPPVILFEFMDWAEQRAGFRPGDAQRHLFDAGFGVYTLQGYLRREPRLAVPITNGGAMLVAIRRYPSGSDECNRERA